MDTIGDLIGGTINRIVQRATTAEDHVEKQYERCRMTSIGPVPDPLPSVDFDAEINRLNETFDKAMRRHREMLSLLTWIMEASGNRIRWNDERHDLTAAARAILARWEGDVVG